MPLNRLEMGVRSLRYERAWVELMKILSCWLRQQIAVCLVMVLIAPFGEAATALPQQASPGQQASAYQWLLLGVA